LLCFVISHFGWIEWEKNGSSMDEEFRIGKVFLVCGSRGLEKVRPTSEKPKLDTDKSVNKERSRRQVKLNFDNISLV